MSGYNWGKPLVRGEVKTPRLLAPWPCYQGSTLKDRDFIEHPSGERGLVLHCPKGDDIHDQWFVDYHDGLPMSRLSLQVGDKGQAVKV